MLRQAVVTLSSMNPAPYTVNTVSRNAVFVFDAGQPVFELIDPDGRHWVMQTWSQVVDPALACEDLAGLADRLNLPDGWSYRPRLLDRAPAGRHHHSGRPGSPGRPDQQLLAGALMLQVLTQVRLGVDGPRRARRLLPVTSVRM